MDAQIVYTEDEKGEDDILPMRRDHRGERLMLGTHQWPARLRRTGPGCLEDRTVACMTTESADRDHALEAQDDRSACPLIVVQTIRPTVLVNGRVATIGQVILGPSSTEVSTP